MPNGQAGEKTGLSTRVWARAAIGFAMFSLMLPAALFAVAGRLDWPMGWVYVGMLIASILVSRGVALIKSPDLLAERARFGEAEGAKAWDRLLMQAVGMYGPLLILVVAGLDKRFDWPPALPPSLQIAALLVVGAGYVLAVWAKLANRFFSAVVRIQKERAHTVVTSGPYRFVRHPAYAGGAASYLATAFMLDALWALVPAVLVVILLVVRTALEDQALRSELEGYEAYAQRTRYRLLPGVW